MSSVLVPQECCNKSPQAKCLKTTEIRALGVLEARSTTSRCQEVPTPCRDCRKNTVQASQHHGTVGLPWHSVAGGQIVLSLFYPCPHITSSPYLSSPCLPLPKTLHHLGFRAYPNNLRWCPHLKILNYTGKDSFSEQDDIHTFQIRMRTYLFQRSPFNPIHFSFLCSSTSPKAEIPF